MSMKKAMKIADISALTIVVGLMIASTTVYFLNRNDKAVSYSIAKSSYQTTKDVSKLETEFDARTSLVFANAKVENSGIISTDSTGAVESLNIDYTIEDSNKIYNVDFQSQSKISQDYQAIVTISSYSDSNGTSVKDYLDAISLFDSFKDDHDYRFLFENSFVGSVFEDGLSYIFEDNQLRAVKETMVDKFWYVSVYEDQSCCQKIFFR
ncbi:MAG: hypothetical protein WCR67_05745, partial [Bacilli bacterium]